MNKKNGFTIMELIVVSGLLVIIISIGTMAFFSMLRGSAKTALMNDIKSSGDYTISVIERQIRDAQKLISPTDADCDGKELSNIIIQNADGFTTKFCCPGGCGSGYSKASIASESGYYDTQPSRKSFLTPETTNVTDCSFTCNKSNGGAKIITIDFTIYNSVAPEVTLRPEEYASLDFRTSVLLRNTED